MKLWLRNGAWQKNTPTVAEFSLKMALSSDMVCQGTSEMDMGWSNPKFSHGAGEDIYLHLAPSELPK